MFQKSNTVPLLIIAFMFQSLVGFAQDTIKALSNARKDVEVLCSRKLHGRGYQKQGHVRAAKYINNRFKNIGLLPFKTSFIQQFKISVNVIKKADITLGDKKLIAGKDFIVHEKSGSGKQQQNTLDYLYIPSTTKLSIDKIIDSLSAKNIQPNLLVLGKKKLTASLAGNAVNYPIIEVIDSCYVNSIKKHISFRIKSVIQEVVTQNIIANVKGTQYADSCIIISAHYDHLGEYSGALFTGANDNASGVASMLSIAEYFIKNPIKYSIVFIAFGAEEIGLLGSKEYVHQNQFYPLKKTKFILNLDLMGNGVDGITVEGGNEFPNELKVLENLNKDSKAVSTIKSRGNAPNSDHYYFLKEGIKGFFIYTLGGPTHYHDVYDTPDNLQLSRFTVIRKLLINFIETINK